MIFTNNKRCYKRGASKWCLLLILCGFCTFGPSQSFSYVSDDELVLINQISIGLMENGHYERIGFDYWEIELGIENRIIESNNSYSIYVGSTYPGETICPKSDFSNSIKLTCPIQIGFGSDGGYARIGTNLLFKTKLLQNIGIEYYSLRFDFQSYLSSPELSGSSVGVTIYFDWLR